MIGIEEEEREKEKEKERGDRLVLSEALLTGTKSVLGVGVYEKFAKARILLIGAGGVGCELLKNLVCSGFQNITVVDLDTIELSNLNRQFLFTRKDIGKPKAVIAIEAIRRLYPAMVVDASLTALVADIKTLNLLFFADFEVVLSALDNLEARRHVNLMGVMCRVPIVESGTAGHSGQCGVWLPDRPSECFDCRHHSPPTTYPVCTIRVTPTQMIHCVVWAKEYLIDKAFSKQQIEDHDVDLSAIEDQQLVASLKQQVSDFDAIASSETDAQFALMLYEKIFVLDIQQLLSLDDVWNDRANKPSPLSKHEQSSFDYKSANALVEWDVAMWAACFIDAAQELRRRHCPIVFDKDDEAVMAFVAAAANLRAHSFSCTPQSASLFKVKEMAGNIIPAVATTNSIVASLACLQAINVVRGQAGLCVNVYITHGAPNRMLTREQLEPGDPDCAVCANTILKINLHSESLQIKQVLDISRDLLSLQRHKDFSVLFNNRLIYDSMDMCEEEVLTKSLQAFGIKIGDIITLIVDDERAVLIGLFSGSHLECTLSHSTSKPKPVKRKHIDDNHQANNDTTKAIRLDDDDMIIL